MDQLLGSASSITSGANLSSILAIFKISSGSVTLETLFQSLIDGLTSFVQFLFSSLPQQ